MSGAFEDKKPSVLPLSSRCQWIYYECDSKFLNEARAELGDHLGRQRAARGGSRARRPSESRPLIVPGLFDLHLHDWGSVGFPAEVNSDAEIDGL